MLSSKSFILVARWIAELNLLIRCGNLIWGHMHVIWDHTTGTTHTACYNIITQQRQRRKSQMHMATHSKEKAYACVQCNKSFGQAATLKKHMLTHSGVKALSCSEQRVKCLFLSGTGTDTDWHRNVIMPGELFSYQSITMKYGIIFRSITNKI